MESPEDIVQLFSDHVSRGEYKKARLLWAGSIHEFQSSPKIFGKATVALFELFLRTKRFSETIETLTAFREDGIIPSIRTTSGEDLPSLGGDVEYKEILLVIEVQEGLCNLMRDCSFQSAEGLILRAIEYLATSAGSTTDDIYKYPSEVLRGEATKSQLAELFEIYLSSFPATSRTEDAYGVLSDLEKLRTSNGVDYCYQFLTDMSNKIPGHLVGNIYLDLAEAALAAYDRKTARGHAVLALVYFNSSGNDLGKWRVSHLQTRLTDDFHYGEAVDTNFLNLYNIVRLCDFHESRGNTADLLSLLMDRASMELASANFSSYMNTSDNIYNVLQGIGANLLKLNTRVGQIAVFFRKTGNTAKTLECLDAFIEHFSCLEVPYMHATAALLASHVYETMERWHIALRFAEIALEQAKKCDTKLESGARYAKFRCQFGLLSTKPEDPEFREKYGTLIETMSESINGDIDTGLYEEAVGMLLYLASLYHGDPAVSIGTKADKMRETLDRIYPLSRHLKSRGAQAALAEVLQRRGMQLLLIKSPENMDKAIAIFERAKANYQKLRMTYHIGAIDYLIGLAFWDKYLLKYDPQSLVEASNRFHWAYDTFERLGQTTECINSSVLCLKSYFNALQRGSAFQLEPGRFETRLDITAKWIDYRRTELSSLGGLQAVLAKQSISRDTRLQDTGDMGIRYYIAAGRMDLAWQWVQKQKARSISDMMGLGNIEHDPLSLEAKTDPKAGELVEQYSNLLSQIRDASPGERMHLRARLAEVTEKMHEYTELKEITHLRLGYPIEPGDLDQMVPPSQIQDDKKIVFVDWFSVGVVIYALVSRPGQPTMIHNLTKPVSFVLEWIQENFTEAEDVQSTLEYDYHAPSAPFRELDFLIQPIADWTSPGDLIVLSPGYPLHSIPLHALYLNSAEGSEILIKRNLVVYTPSLTILKHCVSRALKKRDFHPEGIRCAGIYEYQYAFQSTEQTLIRQNLEKLGDKLGTKPLWGDKCTKLALRSFLDGCSFFHFHGHCYFDKDNVLNHALVTAGIYNSLAGSNLDSLGTSKLLEEDMEKSKQRVQFLSAKPVLELEADLTIRTRETGLSVAEIFEVNLPGPVISIVACESASQKIGPGEEPLGLPTAFLCAGASSYIGTMWEMPCEQGRVFSTEFYESVLSQKGKKAVNLAMALREAVLKIMENPKSSEYIYWAPLVLYGSWFCQGEVFWECKEADKVTELREEITMKRSS
ncbi:hypothetical protein ABW19_dt0201472 [Dactylella cylindrospora]|nr:hypothetical protein ABW19_dt0201472 [Dactylella cylindrospora]